eukprot:gene8321-867_t
MTMRRHFQVEKAILSIKSTILYVVFIFMFSTIHNSYGEPLTPTNKFKDGLDDHDGLQIEHLKRPDGNMDGTPTYTELKMMHSASLYGRHPNEMPEEESADTDLNRYDTNQDGKLTIDEFVRGALAFKLTFNMTLADCKDDTIWTSRPPSELKIVEEPNQ